MRSEKDRASRVVSVDAGIWMTCALLSDGQVRCWGHLADGRIIGDDELPSTAGAVNLGGHAVQVSVGDTHACALLSNGRVRCWGTNESGQLGYPGLAVVIEPALAGDVELGARVTQVAAGNLHTCALLTNGRVRCWGTGVYGYDVPELTIGDDEPPTAVPPVRVGERALQISAGGQHTCALLRGGRVRCWGAGSGAMGYPGIVTVTDPSVAGDVNVGGRVVQVDAGDRHTCAVLEGGRVRCWGLGDHGVLGYPGRLWVGFLEHPAQAGDVDVGGPVVQVSGGFHHTCARLVNGAVRCWGFGTIGQHGYGHTEMLGDDEPPALAGDVNLGGRAVHLALGASHACAVLAGGRVRCWGGHFERALGYGNREHIGDDELPYEAGDVHVQ